MTTWLSAWYGLTPSEAITGAPEGVQQTGAVGGCC